MLWPGYEETVCFFYLIIYLFIQFQFLMSRSISLYRDCWPRTKRLVEQLNANHTRIPEVLIPTWKQLKGLMCFYQNDLISSWICLMGQLPTHSWTLPNSILIESQVLSMRLDILPIFDWQVSLAYATTFLCTLLHQYIFKLIPCSELSFRSPNLGPHQFTSVWN